MTDHPIAPPPELVQQWMSDLYGCSITPGTWTLRFAARAAQWGADQELEACCRQLTHPEWYDEIKNLRGPFRAAELRAVRRPKPSSLKEQALKEMDKLDAMWDVTSIEDESLNTIRRALEALPDD